MKGIVFTELCEMVEKKFGIEVLNNIVENAQLSTDGVYSAVGTYDASDLFKMVAHLSSQTGVKPQDLIHAYGRYFFKTLFDNYPVFFEHSNSFDFLKTIDSHIHVEVKKLYPDAELPSFSYEERENTLELKYSSERRLHMFALGLIEKTIEYYDEKIDIELLDSQNNTKVFRLTKV